MPKTQTYCLLFLLFCHFVGKAQDVHFSQFQNTPLNLNPALTGLFNGDMRVMANYKSQWSSVPVPYMTFSAGIDQKFLNEGQLKNNVLAGGLLFNYDQAGDSELSTVQIGGSAAYAQQLSKKHFLSVGFQLATGQRRFNTQNLTFDEQFVDGSFLPNAPISESIPNTSFVFADASMGINWLFQVAKRMKFNIGTALFHINRPIHSFLDDNVRLPTKWNLNMEGTIQMNEKIDFMPSLLFSKQGTYQERVFGSFVKYHLDQRKGHEKGVLFGTWYRMNDGIISTVAVHFPTWQAGISYDINTSEFVNATNGAGGFELAVMYILTKVKPLEEQKACPIF